MNKIPVFAEEHDHLLSEGVETESFQGYSVLKLFRRCPALPQPQFITCLVSPPDSGFTGTSEHDAPVYVDHFHFLAQMCNNKCLCLTASTFIFSG